MQKQVFIFVIGLVCGISIAGLLQETDQEANEDNSFDAAIDSNDNLTDQIDRPTAGVNTTDQTEALTNARVGNSLSDGEEIPSARQSNEAIGEENSRTTGILAAKLLPNTVDRGATPGATIPEPYASMVKPKPLPESLTMQEMFEEFSSDQRDESWAYPMELGIEQLIARRGAELETVFEFVECRSRFCTVAGVVYEGDQSTVNTLLAEMTQSGWWQTYGGASTIGSSQDIGYRFVTIFPRDPSDVERTESAPQSVTIASGK